MLSTCSSQEDCCQWTGVQCDNVTGRVTELSLPCSVVSMKSSLWDDNYRDKDDKSHCLTGDLDLSLLQLECLSHLNMSRNNFKAIQYQYNSVGSKKFGNFSNLRYLDLSYNFGIARDNLQRLSSISSLQYLNLNGIDLHSETNWLQIVTMLPSLSELYLDGCQLQSISPSLQYANFSSLKILDLSGNAFQSELPKWLFNLSAHISHIDLSDNLFLGQLPETLLNLQNIISLTLSRNRLNGPIPTWIGQLEHLQELRLDSNIFSGPIPDILGNLSSLITLDVSDNLLNGTLPQSLGQLSKLETLIVQDNALEGVVSEKNFGKLPNLKTLGLGSSALMFDFDPHWAPPFQLDSISLHFLSDKVPEWTYTQRSLKDVDIFYSKISLGAEDKFWDIAAGVEFLYIGDNWISGDMSNVLLNSTVTILVSNHLRGGLPRISPNVAYLNLRNNSFSGPISPLVP